MTKMVKGLKGTTEESCWKKCPFLVLRKNIRAKALSIWNILYGRRLKSCPGTKLSANNFFQQGVKFAP